MEKFNVVITGDMIPVSEEKFSIIRRFAKELQDVGLTCLITNFYIVGNTGMITNNIRNSTFNCEPGKYKT